MAEQEERNLNVYERQQLTLLDHYASLVLSGLLAGGNFDVSYRELVESAFEIADYCMAERSEYGVER